MTIKNRDGSVYKLRGPNPIMEDQKIWTSYQVHNLKPKVDAVHADEREPLNEQQSLNDDFTTELQETKPVEKPAPKIEIPEPEPKIEKIEPPVEKPKVVLPKGVYKTLSYCLPATMRDRSDGIYGNKYQTIQYGKPFPFDAVIIEEDDLYITIWTNLDTVTKGSIIYPKKMRDSVPDAQRWWRIQDKVSKNDGWLLTGYPSDFTPSFDKME